MKISFFLLLTIGALTTSSILPANQLQQISSEPNQSLNINRHTDMDDLIQFNANTRFPTIISEVGPVLVNGNTVFQLDWFGQTVWSINVKDQLAAKGFINPEGANEAIFGLPKGTALIGWTYSRITSKIYLHIPATIKGNDPGQDDWKYQYIVPLDPKTGKLELDEPANTPRFNASGSTWNGKRGKLGFQFGLISQLGDGSIVVYGLLDLSGISNGGSSYLIFSPNTNTLTTGGRIFNIDPKNFHHWVDGIDFYYIRPMNTIPISSTKTLFITHKPTESDIYTHLIDNQFNLINNFWRKSPLSWISPKQDGRFHRVGRSDPLIVNNNYGITNDYYSNPVTGETWLPYLDKVFFIRPDNSELGYDAKFINLPKIKSAAEPWNSGIIYSSYLDLRGDLFFNMATWNATDNDWNIDTTVYKLSAATKQISPYVSLATSDNPDILKENHHFKIFAIPTQVGKIMLLNKKTGIAVAVDESPKNPNLGRIIGTLNGKYSFLKSPDFNLNVGAKFKLPSQLRTDNFSANGNGNIVNYDVTDIDDTKGTITVQATINYVPWFASQDTNTNVKTTQITKTFTGLHTVNDLQFSELDYQLKNARVDFINNATLTNFDLLNLTDNGFSEQLRPKVKYEIQNVQSDGSFQVRWTLNDYVPAIDPNIGRRLSISKTQQYQALGTNDQTGYQIGLINGSSIIGGHLNPVTTTSFKNLPRATQLLLENISPSELAKNPKKALDLLIDRSKLKGYPLYLMNVKLTPNDSQRTLDVEITIPASVNKTLNLNSQQAQIFKTTYTDLSAPNQVVPQLSLNKFKTKTVTTNAIQVDLNQLHDNGVQARLTGSLASQMSIANVWNQIFEHNNFDYQNIFQISLIPDNIKGSLQIVLLNKSDFSFDLFKGSKPNNKITVIEVTGFQKITPDAYAKNQIQFADPKNPALLALQTNKLASEVKISDLQQLITIGAAITQQIPGFSLNENNTTLKANDVSGQLNVLINLTNQNKALANHDQVNLPNFYHYTFSDFAKQDASAKSFQPFSQFQLRTKADLRTLTSQYILEHQDEFILRQKGYRLNSANQIEVVYSATLNAVFITYSFANQIEHQNDEVNNFSVVYRLS
ncbi:hypothetical protein J2Z62_000022 [Mycoplasmoides fastidiosum]|uniref:Lipoprotein-associated type-17 domain-containing protein n=1 Tax=Mycoplasmoides fastidiosum TaxID=92758 RepID=A0ABU0LY18_9BACT|nr:lipoprotein 17-related variable surface protein [Mycoplasmoides fastidiosum]MDQ0513584.1 hypothetical protein [Mycoplasmoides fastidiosum]UUD37993.1 lipoprotein 17-related variable surface protein [Mycoplasmoides fastidiosum]